MSDLIRRKDLCDYISAAYYDDRFNDPVVLLDEFFERAKHFSAVDAVEVVRCCRCRFAVNKREHGEMVTYCALDWGMRGVLDPNDYCSYGKEKWK